MIDPCDKCEEVLQPYLDRELTETERREAEAHLELRVLPQALPVRGRAAALRAPGRRRADAAGAKARLAALERRCRGRPSQRASQRCRWQCPAAPRLSGRYLAEHGTPLRGQPSAAATVAGPHHDQAAAVRAARERLRVDAERPASRAPIASPPGGKYTAVSRVVEAVRDLGRRCSMPVAERADPVGDTAACS